MLGKDFEKECKDRGMALNADGSATMGRYGVQAIITGSTGGKPDITLVPSYPDFEGVLPPHGRQFIFDCKVCSQASFNLADFREEGSRKRQIRHLFDREEYGAVTFFLIHLNARELKTKSDPEVTVALPVTRKMRLWDEWQSAERGSVDRKELLEVGIEVPWNCRPGERKPRPDILFAVQATMEYLDAIKTPSMPVGMGLQSILDRQRIM